MPVDAVYLDLHGAMVSEPFEDGEGELLRRVRAAVGPEVPIAISLDYHSNVTPEMVEASDSLSAIAPIRTSTASRPGNLRRAPCPLLLERGRPPGRALRKLPFLIPLNDQCTLVEPSKSVVARSVVAEGELVNLSYLAGFPPSDLYWCGPAVIAHAWSQAAADAPPTRSPRDRPARGRVRRADGVARGGRARGHGDRAHASRPVVLCDTQDNPGCGATADTTGVLETLVRLGAEGAVVGYLCDAEAAAAAHSGRRGRRHRHCPWRPLRARRASRPSRHLPRRPAGLRQDAHDRPGLRRARDRSRAHGAAARSAASASR